MAACFEEVHVNDIGTFIRITITKCTDGITEIEDISSAIQKRIFLQKPDGTILDKAAAFFTDGTDGIIEYQTVSGDIDQVGTWKVQAKVELPGGEWHTAIDRFDVYENVKD